MVFCFVCQSFLQSNYAGTCEEWRRTRKVVVRSHVKDMPATALPAPPVPSTSLRTMPLHGVAKRRRCGGARACVCGCQHHYLSTQQYDLPHLTHDFTHHTHDLPPHVRRGQLREPLKNAQHQLLLVLICVGLKSLIFIQRIRFDWIRLDSIGFDSIGFDWIRFDWI